jgi:hypothetical protein
VRQLRGSEEEQALAPASTPPKPYPRLFFWCLVLVLGLLRVWAHRNEVSPDGISYIEIAWAAARSGLQQVVNGHWSPLYPSLLSLVFRCFHPPVQWEFTAAHLLNFALYAASLASFELFLRELILLRQTGGESGEKSLPIPPESIWIWGHVYFLWASYFWLDPAWVTPDLCVAVLVYFASGLLMRIRRGQGAWLVFVGFGAALGLGYLAKTAMFPLAFVFLFSAFYLSRIAGASFRAAALHTLLAMGVFAGLALPQIISLSAQKGRPTFGDAGRLNYAMYIGGAPKWVHWHGQPPGTGVPLHAMRQLSFDPALYEFGEPIPGSYPLWYDPSYWYEGVRPHFELKGQLRALFRSANMYLKIFSKSGALWVVFVVLWVAKRRAIAWGSFAPGTWLVVLPSIAALGMYSLVLVEFRYVAPFTLVLLMWMLGRMRMVAGAEPRWLKRSLLVVVLAPVLAVTWAVARDLYEVVRNQPYEPWIVAQGLHEMGIPPGAHLGCIGIGLDAYWAHLAGVRIVAEITDTEQPLFVAANARRRQEILGLFSTAGAKAVVTKNAAAANPEDGWRAIPGTQYFIWQQQWLIAAPEKK